MAAVPWRLKRASSVVPAYVIALDMAFLRKRIMPPANSMTLRAWAPAGRGSPHDRASVNEVNYFPLQSKTLGFLPEAQRDCPAPR